MKQTDSKQLRAYIAEHEAEIAYQQSRITPNCAPTTIYLAKQAIASKQDAIRSLRRQLQ